MHDSFKVTLIEVNQILLAFPHQGYDIKTTATHSCKTEVGVKKTRYSARSGSIKDNQQHSPAR